MTLQIDHTGPEYFSVTVQTQFADYYANSASNSMTGREVWWGSESESETAHSEAYNAYAEHQSVNDGTIYSGTGTPAGSPVSDVPEAFSWAEYESSYYAGISC